MATRNRMALLAGPPGEWLAERIDGEALEHGWTVVDKRIEPDHVVVVVQTWPNHSA